MPGSRRTLLCSAGRHRYGSGGWPDPRQLMMAAPAWLSFHTLSWARRPKAISRPVSVFSTYSRPPFRSDDHCGSPLWGDIGGHQLLVRSLIGG